MKTSSKDPFKPYRLTGKGSVRLKDFDPAATPFKKGSEAAQAAALDKYAIELDQLQNLLLANGKKRVLLILQGMDTSGKDGVVRWVFSRTSPQGVKVHSYKAPTEQERAHDYLWRCHAQTPAAGELMVWNRSHYEDVLVPVVNKWIDADQARQRYKQINQFERMLAENNTLIIKCFLHISKEEQRKRLQARIDDPSKHWKFSLGDLEVRKQWSDYQAAYEALLNKTASDHAPWYVIAANDKMQRNLMIAQLMIGSLKQLKLKTPPANPELKNLRVE
jgi:PPK2 family polyphosphate:nucleotide phosphotransferase